LLTFFLATAQRFGSLAAAGPQLNPRRDVNPLELPAQSLHCQPVPDLMDYDSDQRNDQKDRDESKQ
jgi:hypothetical protein